MSDILINLDEPVFVPTIPLSLFQLIHVGNFKWPSEATCLTQESDGALLWWSAPTSDVKAARQSADLNTGLMPLIGLAAQLHCDYFLHDGQEVVAHDWKEAVVTAEDYLCSKFLGGVIVIPEPWLSDPLSYNQCVLGPSRSGMSFHDIENMPRIGKVFIIDPSPEAIKQVRQALAGVNTGRGLVLKALNPFECADFDRRTS